MNRMASLAQANILVKNKEFAAAEKIYLELLGRNPNDDIIQAFLGRLYIRMRKYKGAERILETAYKKRKSAPTIASLAFCKYRLGKFDDSIILYEELFKYDPDSVKIYDRIIQAFRELKMYNFSHAYALKFYSKHPDKEPALVRLTQSYIDIGEIKQAETACANAIKAFPQSGAAWIMAGTLQEFSYCDEELAQDCYLTAIENGSPTAYYHLAVSYQKVGKFKEAEENYKKMIELMPREEYSQASLGTLYLTQKDVKRGYEYFQKREKAPEIYTLKNLWNGDISKNKTLFLYCDQGLGDHMQFIRYLPFLTDKFAKIKVFTRDNCIGLFERSYPKTKYKNIEFYDRFANIGEYDKYVLSSDLPYYLNIDFNNIPYADGYLEYDKERYEYFKNKYFQTDKLKVGMCWKAGGSGMRAAINRTINIDYFKNVLGLENIQFYSVQLDDIFDAVEKYPQMIDLKQDIKTFDDTAAALKNLDLFITADTSPLHLAGALGVKTFLLIPYCSDWRWFENDRTTEWYSSVELFKQQDRRDWFIETDIIYNRLKDYKKC
ncbi:MAG: tetratricopeptide repeat protein [Candidatus Gastranaerophilales bacterium]|nr:tetratricopeptide repeat protein [Candidatus Gastranaerophilales bacterium]